MSQKISIVLSGIEPATIQFAAQWLPPVFKHVARYISSSSRP